MFEDTNGNGQQDGDEPPLPNTNVIIMDSSGNFHSLTTDKNGKYEATVPAGGFPSNPSGPDPVKGTLPTGYVVTVPPEVLDYNTYPFCALVFQNQNGNECKDSGEPSLSADVTFSYLYPIHPFPVLKQIIPTNSDGVACILVLTRSSALVTVSIDTKYFPPRLVQNLGTNPTTHLCNGPFLWDINGYS